MAAPPFHHLDERERGWLRHRWRKAMTRATPGALWLALLAAIVPSAAALPEETPVVVAPHSALLIITKISGTIYSADNTSTQSRATQLAFGPGPDPNQEYLYISSDDHGVRRMDYDPATGALSNLVDVLPGVQGNGIAFHTNDLGQAEMYLSEGYTSANASSRRLSRLLRYVDLDGDGIFGSAGDANAAIVHGIPRDDHGLNQIQINGDALFVGNGVRTRNGALQTITGDTFGESAYGGTIVTIGDLNAVATTANAAGFAAYLSDPTDAQYEDVIDGTTAGSEGPFTSTAADKLRVHSAGTRNPFGLAIDDTGTLWFTNNFHRVNNSTYDRSVIDGTAEGDAFDGPSNDDVHDQMFRSVLFADYGYRNGNWQNNAAVQAAGFFAGIGNPALIAPTVAFDNLDQDGAGGPDLDSTDGAYDQFHDPANPVGLGPSAALTGLAFSPSSFPAAYDGHAFVARWNGQFGIIDGLDYRDVVLVDPATGDAEQLVSGLNAPTDIVGDAQDNLLVVSYYGSIWRITPIAHRVPVFTWGGQLLLSVILLMLGLATAFARPRKSGGRV